MNESMEKTVTQLRKLVPLKDTTEEGDIVLIAAKNPDMIAYAVVREITRDESRKHEWWHVHMLLLGVPPQPVTWTLRMPQYTGQEIFTMGGEERFIQAVAVDDGMGAKQEGKEENDAKEKPISTGTKLRVLK